jgi:hypothetical protein
VEHVKVAARTPNPELRGAHCEYTLLEPVPVTYLFKCHFNRNYDRAGSSLHGTQPRVRLHSRRLINQQMQRSPIVQLYLEDTWPYVIYIYIASKCEAFAVAQTCVIFRHTTQHESSHLSSDCNLYLYSGSVWLKFQPHAAYPDWGLRGSPHSL